MSRHNPLMDKLVTCEFCRRLIRRKRFASGRLECKHRYEAQKKANLARKTQKTQEIKEVKMRPNIDTHDYEVKMRNVVKFLENGDKVKCTLRFRGREMAHQQLGMDLLNRVRDDVEEIAKVEAFPRLEGRQMIMVLAPK